VPAPDAATVTRILTEGLAQAAPAVASIKWQAADQPAIEVTAFPYPAVAPKWFTDWLDLSAPVQQSGLALADGTSSRLTVTAHPQPLTDQVWTTVLVQARISALNIFTIFFLLTLLLRANARMLQRLAQATDAFRQGYLSTRMEVTGTLESHAMAETFNDMAGKVQSLVLSLHETQRQQSEQLHFTRQLIDALPLPVFVRHADGTYLDANRAWQRLFQSQPGADGAAGASLPAELAPERSAHIASAHDNEIRIRPPYQPPLGMALLRACSKSFEQQSQECQMDELQAGVQQPLAVLPQPPVLLQPGKAALDDPALGHHLERMQFTALGDLYRDVSAQNVLDALGKRPAHIAAVTQ
jgi:PAS domain-containing protein